MRDVALAFVVVFIAATGIYLWRSHVDPFHPFQYHVGPVAASVEQPSTPPPPPVKPKRAVPPVAPPVVEKPVVVEAVPVREAPKAIPVVLRDPPPFPTADHISTGAQEDAVTMTYGDPAITAVTSADGRMLETLVYANVQKRSETVIQLQEGKVSSAYTKTTVPSPTGMLVPRRIQN